MPSFKIFAPGTTTLAFVLAALTAPALAGQTSDHVYSIQLAQDGISGTVVIQNVSANKHVNAVKIEPAQQNVSLSLSGWVSCEKPPALAESRLLKNGTKMYFGILGLGHEQVWVQNVLYEAEYLPGHAEWHRNNPIAPAQKKTFNVAQSNFVVPLSAIKNGAADLRFDPVALFNQKLQEHVNGGGNKVEFLRQNHVFSVERPISLGAHCLFDRNNPNNSTVGGAWETIMVPLTVRYQGDPAINDTPVLSAQIAGGTANQLQAGPSPFKVTQMTFQPNMPHHVGACPATTTIRVSYQGQGKGELRIRVNDGSSTIYDSPKIAFDATNGKQHHDFQIAVPKASQFDLNKTVAHQLKVHVRGKDEKEQIWPSTYQYMDAATWNHRCTPQVNPVVGGAGGGGKVGGFQNGGDSQAPTPTLQLKQPETEPAPRIIKRAQ
jgi:hypothetical protein